VLTGEGLFFGKMESDKLIDYVPLLEIVSVEPMCEQQQKVKQERHRLQKKRLSSKAIGLGSTANLDPFTMLSSSSTSAEAEAAGDTPLIFTVQPCMDGHNSGRAAILKAASLEELHEWIDIIDAQVHAAKLAARAGQTQLQRWRDKTRAFYQSDYTQYAIGLVILGSYLMAIANAQMLPWMTGLASA